MKIKTQDLSGLALDWAVSKVETLLDINGGFTVVNNQPYVVSRNGANGGLSRAGYSTNWQEGGPIIQRERIGLWAYQWNEQGEPEAGWYAEDEGGDHVRTGPSPLIAAMRCFVASKLGDEVDVPDELTEEN